MRAALLVAAFLAALAALWIGLFDGDRPSRAARPEPTHAPVADAPEVDLLAPGPGPERRDAVDGAQAKGQEVVPDAPRPPVRSARLAFQVVESSTGDPLHEIDLWVSTSDEVGFVDNAITDREGRASLRVPAGESLTLEMRDAWRTRSEELLGELRPDEERFVRLALDRGYTHCFAAQIVEAETGAPIPGAIVHCPDPKARVGRFGRDLQRSTYFELEADAEGFFEILTNGRASNGVKLTAPGRSPAFVRFEGVGTGMSVATLPMKAAARLEVKFQEGTVPDLVRLTYWTHELVLVEGQAAPGRYPPWYEVTERPDEGGVFRFDDLPPLGIRGQFRVEGKWTPFEEVLELSPGEVLRVTAGIDGRLL